MTMTRSSTRNSITNGRKRSIKTEDDLPSSPHYEKAPDKVSSTSVVTPESVPGKKRTKLESSCTTTVPDLAPSSNADATVVEKSVVTTSSRPTADECAYIVQELGKLHPDVLKDTRAREQFSSCGGKRDILDGVVSTMLSQNTTNANSTRAFANLKQAFPTWQMVANLKTPPTKLEEAIHCGGLSQIKAKRILHLCQTLQEERGSPPSLEYLRDWSNEQVQKELLRFPGLGKKTVSCVLLFTLGREEFPVDTHVYRIAKQQKWIPNNFSRDDAYDYLNDIVPPQLKLDLHCLLIAHGRQCHRCAARGKPQFPPKDGSHLKCPLVSLHPQKGTMVVEKTLSLKTVKEEN